MSSKAPDLAGNVIAEDFVGWGDDLRKEFSENAFNLNVGSTLLSVTSTVKVWHILIAPGERLPAHRHIHDYFWTALRAGRSIQHTDDGVTRSVEYTAGETRHFEFRDGSYLLHDLCNTGDTSLEFVTVEHLE